MKVVRIFIEFKRLALFEAEFIGKFVRFGLIKNRTRMWLAAGSQPGFGRAGGPILGPSTKRGPRVTPPEKL